MKVEVYIQLDADTLRMIHEENMTNLKPFDDDGFYKVDKSLYGHRGSPRYWKDAVAEAARDLGLKPSKIDNSLYMDPGNFIQYVHVDDELLSGDDRLVRDMVQKLQQKFLVKKVDYASTVGDKFQILGRTVERTRLGYRIITSRRYIDQSLKDMDMEKCNPVSTPCLQVTEKDLATEDQFPEVLAGLYRRVTGRLLYVAGQRLDVQQAVKELARGMSAPTNIHWARLKRTMRYLVNKRTSIWNYEPTTNEARDNELTATSDSDRVKTIKSTTGIVLRYAGCTIAAISRTQGCISLSSAEAEYYGTVSALAEAKQIQEILNEYHEDTHIILETDSSAAKANAERPGCGKMKHISVKYRNLQDAITNQEVWLRKSGHEKQCC